MADQILIVDDDIRLSAMLAEYLVGNGFRVQAAAEKVYSSRRRAQLPVGDGAN